MNTYSIVGSRDRFILLTASIFAIMFTGCTTSAAVKIFTPTSMLLTHIMTPSYTRTLPPKTLTSTFTPSLTISLTPTPTNTLPPENWVRLGPDGGRVYSIALDPKTPTTVYAGTKGGMFKSVDGGGHWSQLNSEKFGDAFIIYIAIDPQNKSVLYVVCEVPNEYRKVYKTINGGADWQELSLPDTNVIAIDPSTPGAVYAAGEKGVYKSKDSGTTWESLGLQDIDVLALDPTTPSTIYAGSGRDGIVFKSTDGGNKWKTIKGSESSSTGYIAFAVDPKNPERLFMAIYGGIYTSKNGGGDWDKLNNSYALTDGVMDLLIDPSNSNILYLGTLDGLNKSSDGGKNWESIDAVFPYDSPFPNKGIHAIALDSEHTDTLYATAGADGIYKSVDGGVNWKGMNSGLAAKRYVTQLVIDPFAPDSIYAGVDSKLYKSLDRGKDWLLISSYYLSSFAIASRRANVIYQVCGESIGRDDLVKVIKSVNGGGRWKEAGTVLADSNASSIIIDPTNENILYVGIHKTYYYVDYYKYNGVYKSIDGGTTWNRTGLTETQIESLAIDPMNSSNVYAGTLGEGMLRSEDGGMSWISISTGLGGKSISSIIIDPTLPTTIYAISRSISAEGTIRTGDLYKSTDNGNNWTLQWNSEENHILAFSISVDPHHSNIVYVGTNSGVYKSLDGGATWANIGLVGPIINSIVIDPKIPTDLYVGTDNGTYYLQQSASI